MSTFASLKTKLQTQIGDPNLSDSVAGDALNYTEQSIFNTFDITLNSASQTNSVTVNTNTLTSALPADFQRIVNLYVTSPAGSAGSLKPYFLTPDEFRAQYPNAGDVAGPLMWWTFWSSVEFASKAAVTYTVKLDYTKSVPMMSASGDTPTVPAAFEELLMLGAKIRIYEQKEDFDYAQQFQNRYADLLESFVMRYSTRQIDIQANIPGSRGRAPYRR